MYETVPINVVFHPLTNCSIEKKNEQKINQVARWILKSVLPPVCRLKLSQELLEVVYGPDKIYFLNKDVTYSALIARIALLQESNIFDMFAAFYQKSKKIAETRAEIIDRTPKYISEDFRVYSIDKN